ncbi:MAG: carbohydrate ABC transporter substrate-binding protein [Methylococcales bacterium]
MKKILSLFLCLSIMGSMIFAQGAKEVETENQEIQELEVAVFEGGYGRAYWDAVAEAFEKENPNVQINITANPEIGEIIRPQILSGNAPDFIYLPSNHRSGLTLAMIKDHALIDLTDTISQIKEKFIPGFLDSSNCSPYNDGKVYLAPLYYSAMGLWYNKNLFETENIEVPETWDEFFEVGEKAKEMNRSLFTYQGIYPTYLESIIYPIIASSAGLEGFEDCRVYKEGAWSKDEIYNVLSNIAKIGLDDYLLKGSVAMDHTQAQGQWLLGKALFHPNGSWVEGEMKDSPRENNFEFGFCAAPVLNKDDQKYVFSSIEEIFIPSSAKNIELAKKFLLFQYSDIAIQLNAKNAKGIPPIKGAEKYIKEALQSVTSQSLKNIEIIIINDGSTDNTEAIVENIATEDKRVRLITQKNSGKPSIARNNGIKKSTGKYLAFMDADDIMLAGKLEAQVNILEKLDDIVFVFHDWSLISIDGKLLESSRLTAINYLQRAEKFMTLHSSNIYTINRDYYHFASTETPGVCTITVMMRRDILISEEIWFSEDMDLGEDVDLWLRILLKHNTAFMNQVYCQYRKHPTSITKNKERMLIALISVQRNNLKRGIHLFSNDEIKSIKRQLSSRYIKLAYLYRKDGQQIKSSENYMRGFISQPTLKNMALIFKALLPVFIINRNG